MTAENPRQVIGLRIKEARSVLGLTQKELCEKTGMKLPSLRDYELGNSIPGGDAIGLLTTVDINAHWLITGKGKMLMTEVSHPNVDPRHVANIKNQIRGSGGPIMWLAGEAPRDSAPSEDLLPPPYHNAPDPARLREAIILTERAAAVQPLTPDQRADMILSFYQHLSKPSQQ